MLPSLTISTVSYWTYSTRLVTAVSIGSAPLPATVTVLAALLIFLMTYRRPLQPLAAGRVTVMSAPLLLHNTVE